jgi:hypothetical protein
MPRLVSCVACCAAEMARTRQQEQQALNTTAPLGGRRLLLLPLGQRAAAEVMAAMRSVAPTVLLRA